jgi:hypothetical protein
LFVGEREGFVGGVDVNAAEHFGFDAGDRGDEVERLADRRDDLLVLLARGALRE